MGFTWVHGSGSGASSWLNSSSGTVSFNQKSVTWDGGFATQVNPTTTGIGYFQAGGINADGTTGQLYAITTTSFVGFALNIATLPATEEPIFEAVATSTMTLRVTVTSAGIIKVYDTTAGLVATGTTVLGTRQNGWDYIEIQFGKGATASYAVRINGITEVSGTANQGTNTVTGPRLGKASNLNGGSVNFYYAACYMHDTAFQGIVKYMSVFPSANGTPMSWASGTNTSDYTQVGTLPRDATKYVMSNGTAGAAAMFKFPDPLSVGYSPSAALTSMAALSIRDNVSSTSGEQIRIVSGGTTKATTSRDNGAVDTYSILISDTDPHTSAAWTLAALQAVQVGVIENFAISERCTTVYWQVAYTPTPPSGGLMMGC